MAHYVMVGEGDYPSAYIKKTYRDHLERKRWINGDIITFNVPTPILYDLKLTEIFDPDTDTYVYEGTPKTLYDANPIPCMHTALLDALTATGVDNLQTYDAVLRDLAHGIEYKDYKTFNVVGKIAAADMRQPLMMGTADSTMIDADFDRLVIDESKCEGFLLFRLAENITSIIVDEWVKEEVKKRGIKGIHFYASEYWAG